MAFGVQSIDRQILKNNVVALAKSAKVIQRADHDHDGRDRKLLRPHLSGTAGRLPGKQDPRAHLDELVGRPERARRARRQQAQEDRRVGALDRSVQPHLRARCLQEGDYEIYMVADASGGTSVEAHKYAMDRMVQAGVVPVTWQQVLLEWQRDWARKETYDATDRASCRSIRRLRDGRRLRLHARAQGAERVSTASASAPSRLSQRR